MNDYIRSKSITVPDGAEFPALVKKFCHALEETLLEDSGIPVAFAVMVQFDKGEVMGKYMISHMVLVGHSTHFLPKGGEKAREFLKDGLRKWERECFPESVPVVASGSA